MTHDTAAAAVAADRTAIRDLIEAWAIFRDAGEWERLASLWAPEGVMKSSVFEGSAGDFMARSKAGFEAGVNVLHALGGSVIDINGERAIAQTKMAIHQRAPVHGVLCDAVCHGRFYDFLARHESRWGIVERQPIYEQDRLDPVEPGTVVALDPLLLARFPQGYRYLAYLQTCQGATVRDDLPQTRGPVVEALYRRGQAWLGDGDGAQATRA
jgi:hypothetical protein